MKTSNHDILKVAPTHTMRHSSSEADGATRSLQVLEAKLKAQLKLKNPDESVVKPIRRQLLEQYVRIIVRDCELAARLGVENNLWKLCHYKKIDEYRRAQARSHEQLQDPAKGAAAEQVLAEATQQFGRFLDKSTALYLALLQKAAMATALVLPGYGRAANAAWPEGLEAEVDAAKLSPRQREALVGTCYRCLIYLGDLERYRGTCLTEMTAYDWAIAVCHYRTALLLRPHAGNPHNQRGVIANYHNDDLEGVYHYSRSISCTEPYLPQGRANFEMLLRKNRDTVLVDSASNSQQRRRMVQDPMLRSLVFGRWFVRPLALLNLLSNLEQEALAEEDALTRLPSVLDADRHPSDLCLRMVCACIFTVTDLERQLQEATERMEGSDDNQENQNGNRFPDLGILGDAYQRALDFTFRVALTLMRSAKSTQHHMQAVGVVCMWLLQQLHLVAPNKYIAKVRYDCARLRHSQESFAEGLVDLLSFVAAQYKSYLPKYFTNTTDATPDLLAAGTVLPEDVLLVGWTPFRGCLDVLWQVGAVSSQMQGVLVGVKVVEDKGELVKRRLERVMSLAGVLSKPPGALLCLDATTGDLSVEGAGGRRVRSRVLLNAVVAVGSQQPLALAKSALAPVVAVQSADIPLVRVLVSERGLANDALRASSGLVCGECGAAGQAGRVDEFDGVFYCDACWANLEGLETEDAAAEQESRAFADEGMQGIQQKSAAAADDAQDGGWAEEDNEAFGSESLAVGGGGGVESGLDDLAQQTALFAASLRGGEKQQGGGGGGSQTLEAGRKATMSRGAHQPQGCQDVQDGFLEQLVQRTVGDCGGCGECGECGEWEQMDQNDGMDGGGGGGGVLKATHRQDAMQEDEEEIVFQPRPQTLAGNHTVASAVESRSSKHSILPPFAAQGGGGGGLHPQNTSADIMGGIGNIGTGLYPAQSSLWGGFGSGLNGFGSITSGGGLFFQTPALGVEGDWSQGVQGGGTKNENEQPFASASSSAHATSRFATRNPFAN